MPVRNCRLMKGDEFSFVGLCLQLAKAQRALAYKGGQSHLIVHLIISTRFKRLADSGWHVLNGKLDEAQRRPFHFLLFSRD